MKWLQIEHPIALTFLSETFLETFYNHITNIIFTKFHSVLYQFK